MDTASERRYLIVANQTLASPGLSQLIDEKLARYTARFHVIVPQTVVSHSLASPIAGMTGMAEHVVGAEIAEASFQHARDRLRTFLSSYERLGDSLTGEVVVADPFAATREALASSSFDEIIISTLPVGISRWLHMDLPHRVERVSDLPVTTLVQEHAALV